MAAINGVTLAGTQDGDGYGYGYGYGYGHGAGHGHGYGYGYVEEDVVSMVEVVHAVAQR